MEDGHTIVGHIAVFHDKPHQPGPQSPILNRFQGAPSDEILLFEFHGPAHIRLQRVRDHIGVLTGDQVLLLEAQNTLCFNTEG